MLKTPVGLVTVALTAAILLAASLLIVTGKKWATREKVFRSMRMFMEHVAPQLRGLVPAREIEAATA